MSIRSYFFDDEYYTAQNFADYQKALYNTGIFRADDLKVNAAEGADPFALYINSGIALINGRVSVLDANYNIQITPAETGKARFDIVALRLNVLEKRASPVVLSGAEVALSGVNASNLPALPTLQTGETTSIASSSTCDFPLHKVFVTSSKAVLSSMDDPDGYDAYAADMRTLAIPTIAQTILDNYDDIINGVFDNADDFIVALFNESEARQAADETLNTNMNALKPVLIKSGVASTNTSSGVFSVLFTQVSSYQFLILDFEGYGQIKVKREYYELIINDKYIPGSITVKMKIFGYINGPTTYGFYLSTGNAINVKLYGCRY